MYYVKKMHLLILHHYYQSDESGTLKDDYYYSYHYYHYYYEYYASISTYYYYYLFDADSAGGRGEGANIVHVGSTTTSIKFIEGRVVLGTLGLINNCKESNRDDVNSRTRG